MLSRALHSEYFPAGSSVWLSLESGAVAEGDDALRIPASALSEEISNTIATDESVSMVLLDWATSIARFKPFLFPEFEAEPKYEGLLLHPLSNSAASPLERWARVPVH